MVLYAKNLLRSGRRTYVVVVRNVSDTSLPRSLLLVGLCLFGGCAPCGNIYLFRRNQHAS